jgi:hypothetical protein
MFDEGIVDKKRDTIDKYRHRLHLKKAMKKGKLCG